MTMNLQEKVYLLQELEQLIARLDIELRYEHLVDASSGLCTYKGKRCLLLEIDMDIDSKLILLKSVLNAYDLSHMFISPMVRDFLG